MQSLLTKLFFNIYLLIFVLQINSQSKTLSASWGHDSFFDNNPDIIALHKLQDWQISINDNTLRHDLPFYTQDSDSISLSNSFEIPAESGYNEILFRSLGFNGVVDIYINDNLLVSKPNNSAPFQIAVNKNLIKNGQKNAIKILITKSKNLTNSFPIFTHIYTEPEYIGVTRPFYLEFVKPQLISKFSYSIQYENDNPDFNYNYNINSQIINSLPKTDGLLLEQKITDENNVTVTQRVIQITKNTRNITGGLSLLPTRLWSPQKPVFLNFSFTLKRFAQPLIHLSKRMALRSVRSNKNNILLNNSIVPIRGISYYQNLKNKEGQPLLDRIKADMQDIKKAGFNAVRFVSHIPDERYLSVADTLGLLVFVDMPIKRYPGLAFKKDVLLENLKETLTSTIESYKRHPSFVAIGLAQEVLLSDPATSKFFIILDGSIERNFPFLTYISPVPELNISVEQATDFYMLDVYESITKKQNEIKRTNIPYTLAGKTAMSSNPDYLDINDINFGLNHKILIKKDINTVYKKLLMQGGFLESFMDWHSKVATHQTLNNNNPLVIYNGFYDTTFTKNEWVNELKTNVWQSASDDQLSVPSNDKSSNVFSVLMFFSSLLFLFFYRRYPRLSENYRRSLKHPYGFYVEMRERRIIPVFNSFIVGVHNALIMAVFLSSFIFYYNNSFLAQEFLSVIAIKENIYEFLVKIDQSEFSIIPFVFIWLYLYPIVIGIILKIYGFLSKTRIRLRQALAIGMWSGSPLIFLLPFSIAAYHLILNGYGIQLLYILGIFIIWVHYRLINGIRVLVLAKFRTIFLLLLLSYVIPLIIFSIFFNPQPMWSDYLVTLLKSYELF